MKIFIAILLCFSTVLTISILEPASFKNLFFTEVITADFQPLTPTKLGYSPSLPLPIDTYQISMMRTKHKFLPGKLPSTQIFAYAGKVNGEFKPQFPGPSIYSFKNTPIYVIWSNQIGGNHILSMDISPPFDMIKKFINEVPVVPHMHGLETETGSDGQPNGFWTKTGSKGSDFFSLRSTNLKKNEAIFRYHNTKEGLFWYHDHTMSITRLNVYAGLAGLYEIVDPQISYQEKNILKIYGDIERKYFAIIDKSFNTDGSLYYPNKSSSSEFTSWVPQFFGNTITVNGKVWPKIVLKPQKYRFVFLNGCQSRYLNIYFQNNGKRIYFEIFRRDSDFLPKPVKVKDHLLLIGGRIQIFVDFTKIIGEVMLKNDAKTPYPMGDPVNQFTSQIMKIVIKNSKRLLQRDSSQIPSTGLSFVEAIRQKFNFYQANQNVYQNKQPALDFISQSQFSNPTSFSPPETTSASTSSPTKRPIPSLSTTDNLLQPSSLAFNQGSLNTENIQSPLDVANTESSNIQPIFSFVDFINKSKSNAGNQKQPKQAAQNSNTVSLTDFINKSKLNAESQNQPAKTTQESNTVSLVEFINKLKNTQNQNLNQISQQTQPKGFLTNVPYPRFPEGTPLFKVLIDIKNNKQQLTGVMIDGVGVDMGCQGSYYKQGKTYDFYLINLTMDDHPIHIHLVNFQVIGRFKFDHAKYQADWLKKNGKISSRGYKKIPQQIDVRPYRNSTINPPDNEQKLFLDVIRVPAHHVTIARVKFANHYGRQFPFSINKGKYVWHCHILEHEDNQMMRYFCVE